VIRRLAKLMVSFWRHPWYCLLGALVLGLLAWGGYGAIQFWRAASSFRAAQQAIDRRDFPQALQHLECCLQLQPDSIPTHFLTARTARRAGLFDKARYHLERCRPLQELEDDITLEMMLLRIQQGDISDEVYLKSCVDRDHPDAVLIVEAAVQGYLQVFRLDSALDCLGWWLQREPNNIQALLWRGWVWERLHRFDDARADYHRAHQIDPQHSEARLRLAQLLLDTGKTAEAAKHFEQLRSQQPRNPSVLLGLARCQRERGNLDRMRKLLEEVLALSPREPWALAEQGRLSLEAGRREQAEALLRQAAELAPDDREINYSYAQCLKQLGREEKAKQWFERVNQLTADLKRLDEILRELGKRRGPNPSLRREAGLLYLRYGKEKEGLSWLRSALLDDPTHAPTHQSLADYFERLGKEDLAAPHRQALARQKGKGPT
jgi:tetratricopeptide (TPR) repeat protein